MHPVNFKSGLKTEMVIFDFDFKQRLSFFFDFDFDNKKRYLFFSILISVMSTNISFFHFWICWRLPLSIFFDFSFDFKYR